MAHIGGGWRAAVVMAWIVSACGGGGVDLARCETVSPGVVDGIETGLTVGGGGQLAYARAVRSADHPKAWFVSADLVGPGLDGSGQIATWLTNSITQRASVFAVDAKAREFSDWGSGTYGTMSDDGAKESQDCVRAAAG